MPKFAHSVHAVAVLTLVVQFCAAERESAQWGLGAMPYDPGNQQLFRDILNRLAEDRVLNAQQAIELTRAVRAADPNKKNLPPFSLSRHAIDRFKRGGRIKDTSGLRELFRVLEADGNYAYAFADAPKFATPRSAEEAMALALEAYFSRSTNEAADLATLRRRMAGKFILYRPAWREGLPSGTIMSSLLEVKERGASTNVFETQDFPESDPLGSYFQKDEGFLFCYGRYTFFQTVGTAGNPSLKLWVVTQSMPPGTDQSVRWFHGKLYATGIWEAYDSVRFACLRVNAVPDPISSHCMLDEITDQNIRSALSKP